MKRDAAELREYFADVHPSLVESMMYEGSLYQLPVEFNAADMYLNNQVLKRAGADFPAADWTRDDFTALLRDDEDAQRRPVHPVLLDQPAVGRRGALALRQRHQPAHRVQGARRRLAVGLLLPGRRAAGAAGGGFRWTTPQATPTASRRSYDYLASLIQEDLCTRPEGGNGQNLVGVFSTGRVGVTPAGGFWAGGLHLAGMKADRLRRAVLPALAHPAPPVRRRRATRCCARRRGRTRPGSSSSTPPARTP